LVVWGHRDNLVKNVYADEFADGSTNARVEVLENAAHFPHLEQTERTLALVGDFLAG
jgi:pimeloyl-ACP methyl ester carboxylesterase